MKKFILLSFTLATIVSCQKNVVQENQNVASLQDGQKNSITLNRTTKYGCLVGGNFTSDQRANEALKLNIGYVRDAIVMDQFKGTSWMYDTYTSNGLKVLLNVNSTAIGNSPKPFPTDLTTYQKNLTSVLDKYKPEVVVVENEEINPHYHSGPLTDYINMLGVALNVAHARGLKVANGGIYGSALEVLTYRYLETVSQKRADSFGTYCMYPSQVKSAQNPGSNPSLENDVKRIDTLLNFYKNLDYVNVHLYEPFNPNITTTQRANQSTTTPYIIGDIQEYLKQRTGKPVITNETCVRNNSVPSLVTSMLQEYDQLKFPYMVWYSSQGEAGSVPLYDLNSGVLHPNGTAFSNYNGTY